MYYLEHFHLTHSPFQEEPDPEIFFPGAKREEICQSLLLDILAGKPLIKLIGREGSGKTLICRVIVDRLPAQYEVVYIDNPVGSFDDLLRIACIDLGMHLSGKHDSANSLHELRQLLETQRSAKKKIVLIVDGAEKLFLATLERLVRFVNDNREDLGLTIVLAGRPGLDANLEQLAVFCAHIDIQAGYYLEPLIENETRQYLRFRLNAAGLSREEHGDIFADGAVAKIFDSAQGNMRMINILAEESLQVSCSEKSFMVLLDHVEPEDGGSGQAASRILAVYELLRGNRLLTAVLAGAAILVLLVGFMLSGNSGQKLQPQASTEKALKVLPLQPLEPSSSGTDKNAEAVAGVSPTAPNDSSHSTAVRFGETEEPPPARSAAKESRDGNRLYRERLGASAIWLAGALRGGYTIQLMMLMSDQARTSITNILVQDEYYLLRNQLYIVRKKTRPPTLFVFYGIFDTMDAAREARNTMPVALRKHHPYPLSMSDALKKTEN